MPSIASFARSRAASSPGLIRAIGDFDLAEESVQDAFVARSSTGRATGMPPNPGAWIATTARRKAIDRLRRAKRLEQGEALAQLVETDSKGSDQPMAPTDSRPPD